LAADPAGDRPRGVLLGPDPERPGRLAAAGHLEPLAGLAGRRLPVAVLTVLLLIIALAAEQPQAAEGVAIQPDGGTQLRQGVGVVGQGRLGEDDLGEADHRVRPLAVWPGQAELAGEGDELALVVVLATREVSLTPRTCARAWTASWSMVCRVWWGPSARHSPGRTALAAGGPPRDPTRRLGLVRWVAFDPVSAPKWPHLASTWTALEDRPVPVTTTASGSSGVWRRMSAQVCSRAAMRPEPVVSMAVTALR
jgi:hypothetical protein